MLSAAYMGERTFTVTRPDDPWPGPGEVAIVGRLHRHLRHGPAHLPRRHGPAGADAGGDRSRDVRPDRRARRGGRGLVGRRPGHGAAGALLRAVRGLPAGNQHVCMNLVFIGIDAPGSLQRTWIVPADLLVRLPESLSLLHAALVEPTAVAVHDVRRTGLVAGETAVVVGGGPGRASSSPASRPAPARTCCSSSPTRSGVPSPKGWACARPTRPHAGRHGAGGRDDRGAAHRSRSRSPARRPG